MSQTQGQNNRNHSVSEPRHLQDRHLGIQPLPSRSHLMEEAQLYRQINTAPGTNGKRCSDHVLREASP